MNHTQTTTEELIVAYLDGELVRKEMETVLFERLAHASEARELLREHLILRGAIYSSKEDKKFTLSADLDQRTRMRLETMLANVPPITEPDAAPVRTVATERRLKLWKSRYTTVALLLLLAISGTWYVTRTSIEHGQMAVTNPTFTQPTITTPEVSSTPSTAVQQNAVKPEANLADAHTVSTQNEKHAAHRNASVNAIPVSTKEVAQNSTPNIDASKANQANVSDPADVMLSHKYAKLIKSTRTVAITQLDRISD